MSVLDRTANLYDIVTHQGACHGRRDIDFFSENPHQVEAAKAICATCPVRVECLAYAKAFGEPAGVWGGLDELERSGRRLTSTCPSCSGPLVPSGRDDRCLVCRRVWAGRS